MSYTTAIAGHFDRMWRRHGELLAVYSRLGEPDLADVRIIPGRAETRLDEAVETRTSDKRGSLLFWRSELATIWQPERRDMVVFTTLAGITRTMRISHASGERVWDFADQDGWIARLQAIEIT